MDSIPTTEYCTDFYSHASCEARRADVPGAIAQATFLLTRLLRGATCQHHTGSGYAGNFYSHASCEARRGRMMSPVRSRYISTHTPLARRDYLLKETEKTFRDFYSHASCEARLP